MPSVTLPNWTTHLTGSGPEQHGVLGNGWKKGQIMEEPNNSVNTSKTISFLLGCENVPLSWTGEVPMSIFEVKK